MSLDTDNTVGVVTSPAYTIPRTIERETMPKKKKPRARGGASILCPKCNSPSHVIITKRLEHGLVRRERECLARHGHRFFTCETIEEEREAS